VTNILDRRLQGVSGREGDAEDVAGRAAGGVLELLSWSACSDLRASKWQIALDLSRQACRAADVLHAATALDRRADESRRKEENRVPDTDHHQRGNRKQDHSERAVTVQESEDQCSQRRDCEQRPNKRPTMRHTWVGDSIRKHRDHEQSRYHTE
jgi:hypothetical protein